MPGLPGLPGAPGTNGTNGNSLLNGAGAPDSALGSNGDYYLDTAASELYGPKAGGAWPGSGVVLKGADGTNGTDGAPGAAGPQGPVGPPGADGTDGTDGADGADGAGTIFAASSGAAPAVATTVLGGLAGTGAALPLSGAFVENGVTLTGGTIDSTSLGVPQVFPRDGTVTAVTGRAVLSNALSLIGTTVTLQAQLYTSSSGGTTMTPVPGTQCILTPALTGVLTIGTVLDCSVTGLSIPVTQGTNAMMVVTATAAGISLVNTVTARLATSVAVS
ncbi:hypothetical protein EFK50_07575 [Nocardioides marmoriginsengisoli]|uniref:Collagen-like protein n=2 Tax=Nocardioides marmoriginsengisoli TaxID=661483 RepID=A0A3N0CMT6_9ACTN|nr:hypothetical protein EFK50_07575 [Nocardioides marmoriginsengisoli]